MIDGGETDDKIVAVLVSDVGPTYDDIQSIEGLPSIERNRIEQFFAICKRLPTGRKEVKLSGYEGVSAAIDRVKTALDCFKASRPPNAIEALRPTCLPASNEPETALIVPRAPL